MDAKQTAQINQDLLAIAEHVLAMADDAYMLGHPEWEAIVNESRAAKAKAEGNS